MRPERASIFLIPIIYLGFISLGLPDGTFGVAWPKMHVDLGLPIGIAGGLILVGTIFSALSSFFSGRVIARLKTGPVVLVSCALTGSALLIISKAPSLGWLLLAAAPLGLGGGAVDAGLNGYVARHYSGRHMNWLHACWGIGATCGPLIMAQAVGAEAGWRNGYFILGSIQLSLAVVFLLTLRLWETVPAHQPVTEIKDTPRVVPTLRANSLPGWLSSFIYAVYLATELVPGLWAGSILVTARGVSPTTAGLCVTAYYGAITAGRLLAGVGVDRWGNRRLVAFGTLLAAVGAAGFVIRGPVELSAIALVLLGLGFAPVYPCLMHEVPRRFAPDAVQVVIGRQVCGGYVGAALTPPLTGLLAQVSLEALTWVLVVGVLVLIVCIRWLDRRT